MSHSAGEELERFNVERVPKGTTAGAAGRQRATTASLQHDFLFTWPGKADEIVYADLLYGEIYKVDEEADNITEGCLRSISQRTVF